MNLLSTISLSQIQVYFDHVFNEDESYQSVCNSKTMLIPTIGHLDCELSDLKKLIYLMLHHYLYIAAAVQYSCLSNLSSLLQLVPGETAIQNDRLIFLKLYFIVLFLSTLSF